MDDLQQYPAWKNAVTDFEQAQFAEGTLLTFDWLYAAFNLVKPNDQTPHVAARKTAFAFMMNFKAFETHLLFEKNIALQSVRSQGYKIVPTASQTEWADETGIAEFKTVLRRMGTRLKCLQYDRLDDEGRRKNSEALVRFSMLTGMTKNITKDTGRLS